MKDQDKIGLIHGSGGVKTRELIELFKKYFSNEILDELSDAANIKLKKNNISYATDSFVIAPPFYKGGSIGSLSITGTANDILVTGAIPKYFSLSFVLGASLSFGDLKRVVQDVSLTAKKHNIKIVTGDTKVIPVFSDKGGIIINTSGIGEKIKDNIFSNIKTGDKIIVSGNLGDHEATIFSARRGLRNNIKSDEAVLSDIILSLIKNNIKIRIMRDITRGGLSTILNEIADEKKFKCRIYEKNIPVSKPVLSLTKMMGLNVLEMANEGKLLVIVAKEDEKKAMTIIKKTLNGKNAKVIGEVTKINDKVGDTIKNPNVVIETLVGGERKLRPLEGEGLPRIC